MNARSEASKGTTLPPAAAAVAAKLRAATQAGAGFYDPAVRKLRSELAQVLKAALLADYATAQEHNVEQTLWKVVYYRPIEEFRRRIRLASEAGDRGQEPLRKAKAAFNQLLAAGSTFYRSLALDVQAVYGDGGCPLSFPEEPAIGASAAPPVPSASPIDSRPTISRCLICLGDLARYQINASNEVPGRDWSPAARHYLQAARVLPTVGNAHNQLAVLATYVGDELAAVGHYFRALAVAQPFLVARDNLLLLFEQNRIRYDALRGSSRGGAATTGSNRNQKGGRSIKLRPSQCPVTMADLVTHFVRLHGILFTRINVDTFPTVAAAAAADLQRALQAPSILRALTSAPGGSIADSPAMQLAVMAAFSVSNVDFNADGRPPGVAETMQRKELRQFAVTAVLQLAAAFCGAAANAKASQGSGGDDGSGKQQRNCAGVDLRLRLLPAVHVLLLWAAGHPEVAGSTASGGPELRLFHEALQRLQAWGQAQPAAQPAGTGAVQRLRLPELVLLRGFLPLALAGLTADTPSPVALEFKEEQPVRLASILDVLQKLCSAGGQPGQVAAAAAGRLQHPAEFSNVSAPWAPPPPPASQLDADDEDEEVIVYAPGAESPAEAPEAATPWQRPTAPAASAWTPPHSPVPTEVVGPSVDPVPEAKPRMGVVGGWGGGEVCSAAPQPAATVPSVSGADQMVTGVGGGGGLFDGGDGSSFLGRDIFAQHRIGGGGSSIGFGLAEMGAPTTGGSSGAMSGEMRASSPFGATDNWGRAAPAPVASLWSDAAPQTKSQQDQWQQPQPSVSELQQQQQRLGPPGVQQQQPPEVPGYQPFGPLPWAVPPTPDGQLSPWQPPPPPHLAQHFQQPTAQQMPGQWQPQQRFGNPTSAQDSAQQSSGERQHGMAEEKGSAPPVVQDWSWLSSLPSK